MSRQLVVHHHHYPLQPPPPPPVIVRREPAGDGPGLGTVLGLLFLGALIAAAASAPTTPRDPDRSA